MIVKQVIILLKKQPAKVPEERFSKSLRLDYKGKKKDLHMYSQEHFNQVTKIAFSSVFF